MGLLLELYKQERKIGELKEAFHHFLKDPHLTHPQQLPLHDYQILVAAQKIVCNLRLREIKK